MAGRIEISGGLASGKTTLCELLLQYGLRAQFERFSDNPFWSLFCQNAKVYAFETELTFLLQHYSQIKTTNLASTMAVFDYSIIQDEAYALTNLRGGSLKTFEVVYNWVVSELSPPELIVYLRCSAEEELRRVRNRARPEEKTIEIAYLSALNDAIEYAVNRIRAHVPVIEINSEVLDFVHDPLSREQVISGIIRRA